MPILQELPFAVNIYSLVVDREVERGAMVPINKTYPKSLRKKREFMFEFAELMAKALVNCRYTLKPLIDITVNDAGTYATLTVDNDSAEYDAAEPFTMSFSKGLQDAHVHASWSEAWDSGQVRDVELDNEDAYSVAAEQIVATLDNNEREHISRVEQFGENLDKADWWGLTARCDI